MTDLAIPPDGGWGWVVVFASFMIHVIADGVMYSFGVFYVDLNKYFGSTKAESSWIASIMTSVTFGAGPLVSALVNRYGCRIVCMMGSFVSAMAFAVSTQATNVETMYLTLGLMLGVGLGLMYLPAIVSVTCYFEKQRAFATGIAVCGSGIGTFIMAPLTDILLINYGWKNTMLVLAAILCGCSIFGFLFRSLEPSDRSLPASVVNGVQQLNRKQPKPMVRISEELSTAPLSVPRNLTETNLADRLTEEDSQCSSSENTSTDWNRIATSQPLLAHPPSKSKVFGSHDGIHLFGSSRRPSSTHLEVMRRKDIFYSGSLINIPSYRSNPEVYEQHVVSPVDETAATAMCGCLHCPDNFVATLKNMTGFSLLKHPVFMMFAVSNFLTSIGYIVPYVYIVDKAITSGVNRNSASYLLSIVGISNTVARIVLGYLSDRPDINRLYLYNAALTIAGLGTACNAFCSDFVCLAVYAGVFGFSMGAYVGLTSVILVDLLGLDRLTNAFGLLLLFQGLASLIGPPVTGALYDMTSSYNTGFILAGSVIAASGIMLFFIPCMEGYCSRRWPSTYQSQSVSARTDTRQDNRNNTQPA